MRVCILNEFFYPDDTGGTGTVLSSLAEALRQNYEDVEIDVLTGQHRYRTLPGRLASYEEWNGIRIFRTASPRAQGVPTRRRLLANVLFGVATLLRLLRHHFASPQDRYDVILVGTAPPTLAMMVSLFKRLTKTPYLYVIYDLDPDRALVMNILSPRSFLTRALRVCQRRWLHEANQVIVLGRCMRDYIHRTYDVPHGRITAIPIGADPLEIVPLSKETRFRHAHGLTGFVVLYSGNFGRYHNFDSILDAAKQLQVSGKNVQFVLVGGGAQKERIAARVADENIGNVRMFAFVAREDYADLLASADVSLVTLEPGMEGLCVPSKFYSILASGRPTIAMMGAASEVAVVIAEAACGIQIPQGDTSRLVAAVRHLADNPDEAERMGVNARAVLVRQYGKERVAQDYYGAILRASGQTVKKEIIKESVKETSGAFAFRPGQVNGPVSTGDCGESSGGHETAHLHAPK